MAMVLCVCALVYICKYEQSSVANPPPIPLCYKEHFTTKAVCRKMSSLTESTLYTRKWSGKRSIHEFSKLKERKFSVTLAVL